MRKVYWFEVYQDFGDEGTETIANFDTEAEAETFIENHGRRYAINSFPFGTVKIGIVSLHE